LGVGLISRFDGSMPGNLLKAVFPAFKWLKPEGKDYQSVNI
jgi:hypothetical protein